MLSDLLGAVREVATGAIEWMSVEWGFGNMAGVIVLVVVTVGVFWWFDKS